MNCKDCDYRSKTYSIVSKKVLNVCNAVNKIICNSDKLPKTHPRFCPIRSNTKLNKS